MSKCILCKGTGELPIAYGNRKSDIELKKEIAKKLRKEGYSIRQIMRFVDYKSPNSVAKTLLK